MILEIVFGKLMRVIRNWIIFWGSWGIKLSLSMLWSLYWKNSFLSHFRRYFHRNLWTRLRVWRKLSNQIRLRRRITWGRRSRKNHRANPRACRKEKTSIPTTITITKTIKSVKVFLMTQKVSKCEIKYTITTKYKNR